MKKAIQIIAFTVLLSLPGLLAAQPPHPNNGNAPGVGNTPVGGGAPIDGGLSILLVLGLGYGARKLYDTRKRELSD